MTEKKFLSYLSENIGAVIIGSLLTAAVVVVVLLSPGFKFDTPLINGTIQMNFTKAFSNNNPLLITETGLVFTLLCAIAIRLSGFVFTSIYSLLKGGAFVLEVVLPSFHFCIVLF
ncbi:MAG TPA: hypothetical protein VJ111_10315 [Chitinophagaceae bacterium]|nr:hypothetical protein [Chitinophagaceae bacterium]